MTRRKRLSSDGLKNLQSANLKEGTTAFMGASSHPSLIYIEDVDSQKVTIRRSPYYPEDRQTLKRDIAEDLIARGNATMRDSQSPRKKWIRRDTNLREIQRARITFKIKEDAVRRMDNPAREIERKYRRKYGLETNHGKGNYTYYTTINKENVSDIRELPEIRVLESGKPQR